MDVIATQALTKQFRVRAESGRGRTTMTAVNDLSLSIAPGQSVGFVGPNGAGKSTTIKMLVGILAPTSGTVQVLGLEPLRQRRQLASRIGVVFGQRSALWWDLPLRDSFEILAAMHSLNPDAARRRTEALVEGLDLGGFWQRPVRQLSLGQRMRGEVAAALLHSPELVILDEPTIGLDMVSKEGMRTFLQRDRAERGTTLLLTTHDMSDVERLCERLVVVSDGQTTYDGELAQFRSELDAPRELVVDLTMPTPRLDLPSGVEVVGIEADGVRHRMRFSSTRISAAQLIGIIANQAEIADLALHEPAIEDLIREQYGRGRAVAEPQDQAH